LKSGEIDLAPISAIETARNADEYVVLPGLSIASLGAVKTVLFDRVVDAIVLPIFIIAVSLLMPLPANVLKYRGVMLASVAVTAVAIVAIGRHRTRLAAAVGASLVSWTVRAAILWCMLSAFHVYLPLSATVTMLVIVNIGIALVATPGNVGSFELAAAAALALWKVPSETAFSVAIATHLIEVIPPVILGFVAGGWSMVVLETKPA